VTALTLGAVAGLGLLLIYAGLTHPAPHHPQDPDGPQLLLAGVVVGLLAGVGAWLVSGWPVLTLTAITGGLLLPRAWMTHTQAGEQATRSEAVAEVAAGLRDGVRGGLGVTDALGGLARFGPPALRGELAEVAAQAAILGLPQALEGFARRLGDPLADLLAATLALNQRLGGRNLTEVLDELAAAIRAEAHTLREVRARQAQQRLSARLVAGAPVGILLAIRQTNPTYLTPFNSPLGQAVLALALLLVAAGYAAMVRLARPPTGTRLLPTAPTSPTSTGSVRWVR
jgi:Flp pilus assembly protein TadB